jgi:hypothetical protein
MGRCPLTDERDEERTLKDGFRFYAGEQKPIPQFATKVV